MGVVSGTLFGIVSFVAVLSALLVVSSRKVIYSALFLIGHFAALAVLYLLLDAPFVALTQVLIYAGAIMVLFLFVIMLIGPYPDMLRATRWQWLLGLCIGGLFAVGMGWSLLSPIDFFVTQSPVHARFGQIEEVGGILFSKYLFLFEAVSVLLLVAMIGVVVLGRPSEEKK